MAWLDWAWLGQARLARLRAEYRAAEETLRREVREQYPDLTIGPAAELDRGDALLGVSISLPIPILNANRQGIARAHASREVARAAFETAYYDDEGGSFSCSEKKLRMPSRDLGESKSLDAWVKSPSRVESSPFDAASSSSESGVVFQRK